MVFCNPLANALVLPQYAARVLAMDPIVYDNSIVGIETCLPEAKLFTATHEKSKDKRAIKIGTAMSSTGKKRNIEIGNADLRRHWQIVGQTGTGKSSLLAYTLSDAIKKGYGVTFFDPHGTTIDTILEMVSEEDAKRIRVVRIGDAENPVPINMWNTDNPEEAERIISDLCTLFSEIFDPENKGYVGPRWERWFTNFAKATISLLGKRASFDSIIQCSQNADNIKMLANAIRYRNPGLANNLRDEYSEMRTSDFQELTSWAVSKMQRLTSLKQLRQTLGAGTNALQFDKTVDGNQVTLIDLALPIVGNHGARIVGTLLLYQLWDAIINREEKEMTHIVAIDEAHLFQNNPLPQMLAEGRKFGVALILAHQHLGQLSSRVRDALDANAANFSAFRLSIRDAAFTSDKFEDISFAKELCRFNAFTALTTISVDGVQTDSFTLNIQKPRLRKNGKVIADEIIKNSIAKLVTPYRVYKPLTREEIMRCLVIGQSTPLPPFNLFKADTVYAEGQFKDVPQYILRLFVIADGKATKEYFAKIIYEELNNRVERRMQSIVFSHESVDYLPDKDIIEDECYSQIKGELTHYQKWIAGTSDIKKEDKNKSNFLDEFLKKRKVLKQKSDNQSA